MSEAPDEARQHHCEGDIAQQLRQKGNGEHAEHELFGNRREESAEEHVEPGQARVQQIVVGHVGGRPRAEVVRHHVECRLVGDEDAGQGDAQDRAQEELLAAQAARAEESAQRKARAIAFAIERLRAGGEDEQQAARAQRPGQVAQELLRDEAGVGIRGRVVEFRQGLGIPVRQESRATRRCRPPPRPVCQRMSWPRTRSTMVTSRPRASSIMKPESMVPAVSVARAHFFVIALPGFGHFQVFAVGAGLAAQHSHFQAVSGIVNIEIALLPGEGVIGARRPCDAGTFHEIEAGGSRCMASRRKRSATPRA